MEPVSVAACACLLCSVLLLVWRWRRRVFSAFEGTNIPGPPPSSWLWGNLRDYWTPTTVARIGEWHKQYGDTFGFYLGDQPFVVTKDLDLLKHVLIKDFNNFVARGETMFMSSIHPKLSSSLIFAGGNKWKTTRSCMSQAFSTVKIKVMMAAIHHAVDEFLDSLGKAADEEADFEFSEALADLTFDVIGKGAFGIDMDAQKGRTHPIFILALRTHPTLMSGLAYDLFQSFSSLSSCLLKAFAVLHGWILGNPFILLADQIKPVIKMRKENPSLRKPDMLQNLVEAEISDSPVDIRKLAVAEASAKDDQEPSSDAAPTLKRGHMSPNEVSVNSTFVFLGGYDTTRLTLCYWAFYMAKHPDVQAKMRAEVQEAIGQHGQLDYQVVSGLQYATQVMNETLRIAPAVPMFTTRCAKQDYHYKDMVIKKGTNFMAATYQVHHDPHLWPDPEVFDPDRFSAERKEQQPQLAFIPFGAGPRNCLGMRLAMLETVYTAARVLLRFHLSLADRQKPDLEFHSYAMMLGPKDGIWLKCRRLESGAEAAE